MKITPRRGFYSSAKMDDGKRDQDFAVERTGIAFAGKKTEKSPDTVSQGSGLSWPAWRSSNSMPGLDVSGTKLKTTTHYQHCAQCWPGMC